MEATSSVLEKKPVHDSRHYSRKDGKESCCDTRALYHSLSCFEMSMLFYFAYDTRFQGERREKKEHACSPDEEERSRAEALQSKWQYRIMLVKSIRKRERPRKGGNDLYLRIYDCVCTFLLVLQIYCHVCWRLM